MSTIYTLKRSKKRPEPQHVRLAMYTRNMPQLIQKRMLLQTLCLIHQRKRAIQLDLQTLACGS